MGSLKPTSLLERQLRRARLGTVAVGLVVAPVHAQGLPLTKPEAAGFDRARLARVHASLQGAVDSGRLAGAVALVVRDGHVAWLDTVGWRDREHRLRMTTRTIVRLASMTKPVTSVAAMLLVEEGRLMLSDRVARFLPEFDSMRVLVGRRTDTAGRRVDSLVPAERPITVRDLLTHRSGLTYGFNENPVSAQYHADSIEDGSAPPADAARTVADNVARLARLPLVTQPGGRMEYGLSTDVLGRVVEVVSGLSLDEFCLRRIFEPLGMVDTYFYVPDAKLERVATPYRFDSAGRLRPLQLRDTLPAGESFVVRAGAGSRGSRTYASGGAGLYSTAGDYARFLQMLLNGGRLGHARLLSPHTVALMTANHTSDLPMGDGGPGTGFGLGFAIVTDPGQYALPASRGTYWWDGGYGTAFWVDPAERLIGVFLKQGGWYAPERFQVLIYQALIH